MVHDYDHRRDTRLEPIAEDIRALVDATVDYVMLTEREGMSNYHPYDRQEGILEFDMIPMDFMSLEQSERAHPVLQQWLQRFDAVNAQLADTLGMAREEAWASPERTKVFDSIGRIAEEKLRGVAVDAPKMEPQAVTHASSGKRPGESFTEMLDRQRASSAAQGPVR